MPYTFMKSENSELCLILKIKYLWNYTNICCVNKEVFLVSSFFGIYIFNIAIFL